MLARIIPICLIIAGCAHNRDRFTATMEADPTEIGVEGLALLNQLSRAYVRVPEDQEPRLCEAMLPSFQERDKYTYRRHLADGGRVPAGFQCVYLNPSPATGEVERHIRAGLALSDLYCDTFFRRIARHWNERLFLRNTSNDVGTAVSAALGLAQAGSTATGAAGVAFGLIDGTFRNYDSVFVVSPDLPNLQNLVRAEQAEVREDIEDNMPINYYDAQRRILEYANHCSYTGMKALLNESVDAAVNERNPDGVTERLVDFQTEAERRERLLAERRAAEAEATLEAQQRERDARAAIENAGTQEENAEGGATAGEGSGAGEEGPETETPDAAPPAEPGDGPGEA